MVAALLSPPRQKKILLRFMRLKETSPRYGTTPLRFHPMLLLSAFIAHSRYDCILQNACPWSFLTFSFQYDCIALRFKAAEHYQKSADFYEMEGQGSNRDGNLLKVAHFYGSLGKFSEACELFEKVASACAEDKLRKFGVRDHLLKAGLCFLAAGDVVAVKKALERYPSISFEWADSREAKFLSSLLTAAEGYDEAGFNATVQDYDSLSRLDQWKTSILVKAKEMIKNEDADVL